MPRYIDAEKAEKIMHRMDMQDLYLPVHFKEMVLDETPTEEVAPVVHAHWDPYFEDFKITSNWTAKVKNGKCSNCKNETGEHIDTCERFYKYCFNCGAKMDEVQDGKNVKSGGTA